MKANSFINRHYFAGNESLTTHAAAVAVGVAMMIAGLALTATVAFLPVGVVIGILGLLIFGGGIFAHIQRPVKFHDLLDATVSLAGAAIAMTFGLAIALFLVAFSISIIGALVTWLSHLL